MKIQNHKHMLVFGEGGWGVGGIQLFKPKILPNYFLIKKRKKL
jgi:hypothetical protein